MGSSSSTHHEQLATYSISTQIVFKYAVEILTRYHSMCQGIEPNVQAFHLVEGDWKILESSHSTDLVIEVLIETYFQLLAVENEDLRIKADVLWFKHFMMNRTEVYRGQRLRLPCLNLIVILAAGHWTVTMGTDYIIPIQHQKYKSVGSRFVISLNKHLRT